MLAERPELSSTTSTTASAVVGQNATLEISIVAAVPGITADSIEWYKDDVSTPIEATTRLVFGGDRLSLSFIPMQSGDAGNYTVRVSHPAGDFSVFLSLIPAFTVMQDGEQNVTANSGEQVSFTCIAYGLPSPRIVWLKGDNLVSSDNVITTSGGEPQTGNITSTLTINALITADEGIYFCRAINGTSSIQFPFYLMIKQTTVDPCIPNPCESSGRCVLGEFSIECECVDGFVGPTCATRECASLFLIHPRYKTVDYNIM